MNVFVDLLGTVIRSAIVTRCLDPQTSYESKIDWLWALHKGVLELGSILQEGNGELNRVANDIIAYIEELSNPDETSDESSSSFSSRSSASSRSSQSDVSSNSSSQSSRSSQSSASSRSSGSSQSSSSSQSEVSSASSGSSASSTAITPVPTLLPAVNGIGIGVRPDTLRTEFLTVNRRSVSSQSEFVNALNEAVVGGRIDRIALPPNAVFDYPRNALLGLKRAGRTPLVIETDSPRGQSMATLRGFIQEKFPCDGLALVNLKHEGGDLMVRGGLKDMLIEDVIAWLDIQGERVNGQPVAPIVRPTWRFVRMMDNWGYAGGTLKHGIFTWNRVDAVMEYCFLDHNGWDPAGDRNTPYDQGGPSSREHNAYFAGPGTNDTVQHCIFARGSSHGIHFRCGGKLKNNLFIKNPIGAGFGYGDDGYFGQFGQVTGECTDNAFVGSDDIGGVIGSPLGIGIWLTATKGALFERNSFILNGTSAVNNAAFRIESQHLTDAVIRNNRSYLWDPMVYKDPSGPTSNVSLVESNNRGSLTYSELALAQHVMSTAYLNQVRNQGVNPQELQSYLTRLHNGFGS